jgi:hypothetical protein
MIIAAEGDASMSNSQRYFVKLLGTRNNWPDSMTVSEEKIMTEHFHYLHDLVAAGKVLLAGSVFDERIGGKYEIYFDMNKPEGSRGSEQCRILSFLPKQMLSFERKAPPSFGKLRFIYTRMVIFFEVKQPGQVTVKLHHLGFARVWTGTAYTAILAVPGTMYWRA